MNKKDKLGQACACFEQRAFESALSAFSELLRDDELPDEFLFEVGMCELKLADGPDARVRGLAVLEKVAIDSPKFSRARRALREYFHSLEDPSTQELLQWLSAETLWLEAVPDEDNEPQGSLVVVYVLGLLGARGAVPEKLHIECPTGAIIEQVRHCLVKGWLDARPEQGARDLEKLCEKSILSAVQLCCARLWASAGEYARAVASFDQVLERKDGSFERALPGIVAIVETERASLEGTWRSSKTTERLDELEGEARARLDADEFEEALKAWQLALDAGGTPRRILLRMAAVALHRLNLPHRALCFIERLDSVDRRATEARMLERAVFANLVVRIRGYVRVGLVVAAFDELSDLWRRTDDSHLHAELEDIFLDSLASPWLRLLRLRLRRNAGMAFRMREQDSPVWKLLRQARGRVDGDDEVERAASSDDPSQLPRIEKETELLRWLHDEIVPYERSIVEQYSLERYRAIIEDKAGYEVFQGLLNGLEPAIDKYGEYVQRSHLTVKDFLGSFLPQRLRDKVCDEDYLDVLRIEGQVEQDLRVFVRSHYPELSRVTARGED